MVKKSEKGNLVVRMGLYKNMHTKDCFIKHHTSKE